MSSPFGAALRGLVNENDGKWTIAGGNPAIIPSEANLPAVHKGFRPLSRWACTTVDGFGDGGNPVSFFTTCTVAVGGSPGLVVNGQVTADNFVSDVKVNGISNGVTTPNLSDFQDFTLNAGWADGSNTIEFIVDNIFNDPPGAPGNWLGLRVEWYSPIAGP